MRNPSLNLREPQDEDDYDEGNTKVVCRRTNHCCTVQTPLYNCIHIHTYKAKEKLACVCIYRYITCISSGRFNALATLHYINANGFWGLPVRIELLDFHYGCDVLYNVIHSHVYILVLLALLQLLQR